MIRKAEKRDIPFVLELLRQVNLIHHNGRPDLFRAQTKYGPDELETLFLNKNTPVFVWTDDADKPCGYCFCQLHTTKGDRMLTDIRTLYIDDLCVDETKRGMHIGTDLLAYVKSFAKAQGCYNVTLNVWALNTEAYRFYEKAGMHIQKFGMETIL